MKCERRDGLREQHWLRQSKSGQTPVQPLGEISDPQTNEKNEDLVLAKHTIDTLRLLEEKTKGNLTGEEQDLLKHALYDLQMRYVAKASTEE